MITMTKYHCFLLLLSLFCTLHCPSATNIAGKKNFPSSVITGTVFCDTCSLQKFTKSSFLIPGASISVECADFREQSNTNDYGSFTVQLPQQITKNIHLIKSCKVELLNSNNPSCSLPSLSTQTSMHLKLDKPNNGVYEFTAGFLAFKPLQQQQAKLCDEYKQTSTDDEMNSLQQSKFLLFPPSIPYVPSPPSVGGVPLPPNPLQPPPSLLPPNPLQPPPAPIIGLPPFPNVPVFAPPPPPPALLPPLIPVPPSPLFPGIPPASHTEKKSSP